MTLLLRIHGECVKIIMTRRMLTSPRGTANTLKFSCFESQEAKLANFTYTRFSELAGPSDKMPLGRLWSSAAMLGEYCYQYPDSKQKGELLSTAFTARDIMQIVDAVEDDGLLRYWGTFSLLNANVCRLRTDNIQVFRTALYWDQPLQPCFRIELTRLFWMEP